MESVIIHPHSLLGLPSISAFAKSKFGRSNFPLKEIADGCLVTRVGIRADGHRRSPGPAPQNPDGRRSLETDDEDGKRRSSKGKTYTEDEILAVFRRIQTSISRGESSSRIPDSSESVLDVLCQSDKGSGLDQTSTTGESGADFPATRQVKTGRPPSNFVKRSPIPSVGRGVRGETESGSDLDKMRVGELKELARSRGVKGYSKLRKAELVDLLKSS